jgi:glycerophosphoryl diester phosphodiesterase
MNTLHERTAWSGFRASSSSRSAPLFRSLSVAWALVLLLVCVGVSGCGIAWRAVVGEPAVKAEKDPVFDLPTPILFAHRGGNREAPESTEMAFCHAICHANVDVLELDVQLTRDKQFVVWHGPKLDNVRIEDQPMNPCERQRRKIHEYDWDELEGKAWVADPVPCPGGCAMLRKVPRLPQRQLMLLTTFLDKFRCHPLNIELKESVGVEDLPRFIRILDNAPVCPDQGAARRTILVVSQSGSLLHSFRNHQCGYPTGSSILGNLATVFRSWVLPVPSDMRGRALQTSDFWIRCAAGQQIVERVHSDGGAVHVFVSNFLGHSLDDHITDDNCHAIQELVHSGVDGIMTARPRWVHGVIDGGKEGGEVGCAAPAPDHDHDAAGLCKRCQWPPTQDQCVRRFGGS